MAWNHSASDIDNENKTTKKRFQWRWLALGLMIVDATIAIAVVQSIPAKKAVVSLQKDVKWEYQVIDGGITLGGRVVRGRKTETAVPRTTSGALVISEIIGGIPVRGIADHAFSNCSNLTSVTIPSSVTRIGNWAFEGCSELRSVAIPSSVTSIGRFAFAKTPFYDNLPDGMVILGGGVLYAYKGKCPVTVTIPAGVASIGNSVFSGRRGLTSVTIPPSVTCIGWGRFAVAAG